MKGNFGFTSELLEKLLKYNNKAPLLITSSIQAALDNPYGKSKKAGEDLIFDYGTKNGVPVYVYRLPNVFGKWCRPNYNSAIATFCNNIAHVFQLMANELKIPHLVVSVIYTLLQGIITIGLIKLNEHPYIYSIIVTLLLMVTYIIIKKKYYYLHEQNHTK